MPPRKKGEGAVPPASGSGEGINALPDSVIHHVLGFLDAKEAVQTCVLARRWRHLWQSASSLRIRRRSLMDVSAFLEHLLLLRAGFKYPGCNINEQRVHLWVQYALLCKARVLKLSCYLYPTFEFDDLPLVSQHMRILKLFGAVLKNRTCDFESCPALERLHITDCSLSCVRKISSKSTKHLSFTSCDFENQRFRTLIYAPSLISLKLDDQEGYLDFSLFRTPVLDRMPLLKNAFVRLTHTNENDDSCTHADSSDCVRDSCNTVYGIEHDNSSSCVLLEGLSEAENLSLIAESKTFIFKRDLKQCPTFSKLRTLFLNDYWCVAPDFHELNCILKHSPVLEKLTLQLFSKRSKPKLRIEGSWNPPEIAAAISGHLKTVEVKCEVIDDKVIKVVKFMSSFYISFRLDEAEILEE
ncbi:MEIOTIC F-BOX protein MOF-like [Miscanthus floridulus]|uniref:MEIOTIC F-BOX protein MOF-like n=1 Tax=Miscanthus floridulus TaxID=154761 RepID=UPI00345B2BF5